MKIFIGLNNIASVFSDLKSGFSDLGVETFVVSKYKNESVIIHDYSDFNINTAKNLFPIFKPRRITFPLRKRWDRLVDSYILKKSVKECDAFIFISDSFFPDFSDLEFIKKQGKKVFCFFGGDDVRCFYVMEQEFKMFHLAPIEYDSPEIKTIVALQERLIRVRNVEKYADYIFSRLDQAQLQLRPYYRWNMMVDPLTIPVNTTQRSKRPVIAHAPSVRSGKGTKYVLQAFEDLKNEGYDFEINLIENVPNHLALKMYNQADIVIDQLLCPGAGKLATEALASGAIVMSNMSYDRYPQKNSEECPIVDVNPNTLKERLAVLISDYALRCSIASKSRSFVEKYLDIRYFCQKVLNLSAGEKMPYDYIPNFFNKFYNPISNEERILLNQWTTTVKDCSWYNDYVSKGSRNGLDF